MTRTRKVLGAITLGLFMLGLAAPAAHAQQQLKCIKSAAKAAARYVKKTMRDTERCIDKNLTSGPGSCDLVTDLQPKIDKQETKLRAKIDVKCGGLSTIAIEALGFPGKCEDANILDGFTVADLKDCLVDSHEALVAEMVDRQYGTVAGGPAITDTKLRKCQREIARSGFKFATKLHRAVQTCRNKVLDRKLSGFAPRNCQLSEPKTALKALKAESKARKKILARCDDALNHLPQLDVCDVGGGPALTAQEAADCIVDTHRDATDNPDLAGLSDLIDFEYATPRACGDGVVNVLDEECDGDDDAACPGQCGAATSLFPCFCLDIPRERWIQDADIDQDNAWTGVAHDNDTVGGAGYILDLYDCDGPEGTCDAGFCTGGPNDGSPCANHEDCGDHVCTAGPSCALPPNGPCFKDSDCAGGGNFCRKRRTATGPHCHLDVQKACTTDAQCNGGLDPFGVADHCVEKLYIPPFPLSAGGVATCTLNFFSEDIVGTTNVQNGATAVRLRQRSLTHFGGQIDQPCPVCGGFCSGPPISGAPTNRPLCDDDSDCGAGSFCVTEPICSFGPFIDQPCRQSSPFGGFTLHFGNPSEDCPPNAGANISGNGLDVLFNPIATGPAALLPTVTCNSGPFSGNACLGGANAGRPCTVASNCPGGSCQGQCFCPNSAGGVAQQPNACSSACVGGANDGLPCNPDAFGDSQCDPPTGFCHRGDCRLNPADTDTTNEGQCSIGPVDGLCAETFIKVCDEDADCRGGACQFCQQPGTCIGGGNDGGACTQRCSITTATSCTADGDCPGGEVCVAQSPDCPGGTCGEACDFQRRQCFVNSGIFREGVVGTPDRTLAAIYCLPPLTSAATNLASGLPGPGANVIPGTVTVTGF